MLVFIPLAVEQITTHMSAGPPISSLNLGFLPQINRTLLPTRFACIKSLTNDVFFFFKSSQVCIVALPAASRPGENLRYYSVAIVACVCRQWRVWKELHFLTSVGHRSSPFSVPAFDEGLVTCSYTVITHLSRPAFVDAVMSH